MLSPWYILYAKEPLKARERCLDFKSRYEDATGVSFELEIRTPNEYVGGNIQSMRQMSKEARDFLFRYIFVRTNIVKFEDMLRHPDSFTIGVRLMHNAAHEQSGGYAVISDEEINHFFNNCRIYTYYNNHRFIPFYELEPTNAKAGDRVLITEGQYEGLRVTVAPDQTQAPENSLLVLLPMLGDLYAVAPIPHEHLRMLGPAQKENDKYAHFDQFFDYFSTGAPYQRYLSGEPSDADLARALRMLSIAGNKKDESQRALRDSKRLRYLRISALLVSHKLLNNPLEFHQLLPEWQALTASFTKETQSDRSIKLLLQPNRET